MQRFLSGVFNSTDELTSRKESRKIVKDWIPERTLEFCCTQCGLNHEVRDFIRAMLIHLIDKLEGYDKFFDFLKENHLITQEAYEQVKTKARNKQ